MSVALGNMNLHVHQAEEWSTAAKHLSPFQIEKFTYFFTHYFDNDKNGVIDAGDFAGLNERLRNVAGWSMDDDQYRSLVDENSVFLECLLEQVRNEQESDDLEHRSWAEAMKPSKVVVKSVNLMQWLNMWGRICNKSAGISDMPIWVQLLPNCIYNVMDSQEKVGQITQSELEHFYYEFTGLRGDELEETSKEGYRAMTANGDYELTLDNFKLLFANFLLGKTIYGPGKYIFGCFDNSDMTQKYQVLYE